MGFFTCSTSSKWMLHLDMFQICRLFTDWSHVPKQYHVLESCIGALSGRLNFMVRRHKFNKDLLVLIGSLEFTLSPTLYWKKNVEIPLKRRGWMKSALLQERSECKLFNLDCRMFISHKVFLKSFCKSQFQHRFVNSFFILVIVKGTLTDLWGEWLPQNDFKNTLYEIRVGGTWHFLSKHTLRGVCRLSEPHVWSPL